MLHDNVVTFVFVRDAEVVQESIGRLAHDHGAEELTTEPGTAAWRDACLDDGDLEVGAFLRELVGGAQAAGACAYNDNVGLGIGIEVGEVATGWQNC